jgi:hypothetical protein
MDLIRNSFFTRAATYQQVGENRSPSRVSTAKQFVRYLVPVASGCFLLGCALEVFEKASSVYYIENGQLREFATSVD